MAESANTTPGPNPSDSKEAVMEALRDGSIPAMTAGDVASRIDYTAKTAKSRLKELEGEGRVESGQIGGATAFWIPSTDTVPDGHGGYWGHFPIEAMTPIAETVSRPFATLAAVLAVSGFLTKLFSLGDVWMAGQFTAAFICLAFALLFHKTAIEHEDKQDPSVGLKDVEKRLYPEDDDT